MVSGYIFLKEERYRSVISAQVPDTPIGKGRVGVGRGGSHVKDSVKVRSSGRFSMARSI